MTKYNKEQESLSKLSQNAWMHSSSSRQVLARAGIKLSKKFRAGYYAKNKGAGNHRYRWVLPIGATKVAKDLAEQEAGNGGLIAAFSPSDLLSQLGY